MHYFAICAIIDEDCRLTKIDFKIIDTISDAHMLKGTKIIKKMIPYIEKFFSYEYRTLKVIDMIPAYSTDSINDYLGETYEKLKSNKNTKRKTKSRNSIP